MTWELKRTSHQKQLMISVSIFKWRVFKRKWTYELFDPISFVTTCLEKEFVTEQWLKNMSLIKKIRPYLLTTRIHSFQWNTRLGTGKAHHTAIYSGLLWSIKQMILTFSHQYLDFRSRPSITVDPNFNQSHFSIELKGTASINFKTALYIMIHVIRQNKIKKG
ncbi:MAG TPA: DUF2953 domain-containing protein [Cerasibacillus sp.]|uniref:DUF2953 domain-containing protein n=1 Tax=Cerasibacillus sp. TaxID=2498711 RepID=UPI002F3E2C80